MTTRLLNALVGVRSVYGSTERGVIWRSTAKMARCACY